MLRWFFFSASLLIQEVVVSFLLSGAQGSLKSTHFTKVISIMWDMARITVSLLQVPPDQAINELTELNFSTPFLGINFLKIPKEVS